MYKLIALSTRNVATPPHNGKDMSTCTCYQNVLNSLSLDLELVKVDPW